MPLKPGSSSLDPDEEARPRRARFIHPDAIFALLITKIPAGVVCNALGVTFNEAAFPVVVTRIRSRAMRDRLNGDREQWGKTVHLAAKEDFASARRWSAENAPSST
jgi:hypothetical protein